MRYIVLRDLRRAPVADPFGGRRARPGGIARRRVAGLPPRATSVVAKTLATARTEGFAAQADVDDRGVGIVTAP